MSPSIIVLIIVAAAAVAVLIILYILGKRMQKKRDEQQETIESMKQTVSMLVIDKKKLRLKESGLPDQVISQAPWYARRSKLPIVKAKVGPKIMTLMCENKVFEVIPVKKEVKAVVSGLYITGIKSVRGGSIEQPQKKKGFFSRNKS